MEAETKSGTPNMDGLVEALNVLELIDEVYAHQVELYNWYKQRLAAGLYDPEMRLPALVDMGEMMQVCELKLKADELRARSDRPDRPYKPDEEGESVALWWLSEFTTNKYAGSTIAARELYDRYRQWASEGGHYVLTVTRFGRVMKETLTFNRSSYGLECQGVAWKVLPE